MLLNFNHTVYDSPLGCCMNTKNTQQHQVSSNFPWYCNSHSRNLQTIFPFLDGWTSGYTFHGDAARVFTEFFGGENPFAGKYALD